MTLNKEQLLAKRKPGRPREYDPDKIAEELLEWVKNEESINFAQFCADRGYLPGLIWRLEKESEDFSYAYTIAKLKLAERRERYLNQNLLNYGAYQRYQHGYDAFLARAEDSEKDKETERRKGIAEQQTENFVTLVNKVNEGKVTQRKRMKMSEENQGEIDSILEKISGLKKNRSRLIEIQKEIRDISYQTCRENHDRPSDVIHLVKNMIDDYRVTLAALRGE